MIDEEIKFEPSYWQFLQQQLAPLTAAGLIVSPPRNCSPSKDHEFAFRVSKPRSAGGNSIPDASVWQGFKADDDRECDAPGVELRTDNGQWVVTAFGRVVMGDRPAAGFCHRYDRIDDAVCDILDFHFGDPERMQTIWRDYQLG